MTPRTVDHAKTTIRVDSCDACSELVYRYTDLGLVGRLNTKALGLREESEALMCAQRTYNVTAMGVSLRGGIEAFMAHGNVRPGVVVTEHACDAGSTPVPRQYLRPTVPDEPEF